MPLYNSNNPLPSKEDFEEQVNVKELAMIAAECLKSNDKQKALALLYKLQTLDINAKVPKYEKKKEVEFRSVIQYIYMGCVVVCPVKRGTKSLCHFTF